MKKTKIISLTATALILSLCGIFLQNFMLSPTPVSAYAESSATGEAFSLIKATELEKYCMVAEHPDWLKGRLKASGFEDFEYYESVQTGANGSGIALSVSRNKGELLVVVRATVGAEWYSNFHIGTGETHAGFLSASLFAEKVLEEYTSERTLNKSELKITITGHSRGGAVANLMAKSLIDAKNFSKVTAYAFASPNTTRSNDAHSMRYDSIYNIQNPEDFVCFIPLESWGYTKYGKIINLPQKSEDPKAYAKMEENFYSLTGYKHVGYERGHEEIEEFCAHAAGLASSVEEIYENSISSPLGDITLYGYLEKIASLLSGENPVAGGLFILSSMQSSELRPMTEFLTKGMCFDTPEESFDLSKSAINSGHTYETYLSWLEILDESYFENNPASLRQ